MLSLNKAQFFIRNGSKYINNIQGSLFQIKTQISSSFPNYNQRQNENYVPGQIYRPRNLPTELEYLYEKEKKDADVEKYTAKWFVEKFPEKYQPYLRLSRSHNSTGSFLLFWPGAYAIAMAAPSGGWPDPFLLTVFGLGSYIMRSAGCIVNDMWDKDFDKQVERTKNRPLASGELTMKQATIYLSGHIVTGLGLLACLPPFTWKVGLFSLLLLTTYPAMKRITNVPQAFLGITFNWGVPLGWAAATSSLAPLCVVAPLLASCWCWTMVYDTIYAFQDRTDDIKAGIKSTAVKWGEEDTRKYLQVLAVLSGGMMTVAGAAASVPLTFYLAPAFVTSHLTWQIHSVNLNNKDDCARKFRSNVTVGAIVFSIMTLAAIVGNGNESNMHGRKIDWEKRGFVKAEERGLNKEIDIFADRLIK